MSEIILRMPHGTQLMPDNKLWQNRFQIRSGSSTRLYTVAQNKAHEFWSCSCPGWVIYRNCKHLKAMNLPGNLVPYKVIVQ